MINQIRKLLKMSGGGSPTEANDEFTVAQMRGAGRERYRSPLRGEAGMTLIEIMVVMTIIAMIATAATIGAMKLAKQAKAKSAATVIQNFETAVDAFYLDNGFYPSTEQGLEALYKKPSGGRVPNSYPKGGYMKKGNKPPVDPWQNPYIYRSPGAHGNSVEIISLGADGQDGGEGDDADINSWEIGVEKDQE